MVQDLSDDAQSGGQSQEQAQNILTTVNEEDLLDQSNTFSDSKPPE